MPERAANRVDFPVFGLPIRTTVKLPRSGARAMIDSEILSRNGTRERLRHHVTSGPCSPSQPFRLDQSGLGLAEAQAVAPDLEDQRIAQGRGAQHLYGDARRQPHLEDALADLGVGIDPDHPSPLA